MPSRAAYFRQYRAKRKAADDPVARGSKTLTKFDRAEFVAIDGEGCDDKAGNHHYMMMCAVATDGLEYTLHGNPFLVWTDCFPWLLKIARNHPHAVFVIFSGGYDATMMLRSFVLPGEETEFWQRVMGRHEDGSTYFRRSGYAIRYQPGKQLYILSDVTGESVTIWDVWGYFQASFVRTLASWKLADEAYPKIVAGKERRGEFVETERRTIETYCLHECRALARLMTELHARLEKADLRVNRWDGAGSVGSALLKRHNVKEHMHPTPPEMLEAARCAYFGGRIELVRVGHYIGSVYRYDINSAYPAWARVLPSLARGVWMQRRADEALSDRLVQMALYHVRYSFPAWPGDMYPFPYRYPSGEVIFPREGEGWYWSPEVVAASALRRRFGGSIEVLEAWQDYNPLPERPFAFIDDVFAQRREWHQAGEAAEYVLKLGLNSIYGKLAQQVGSSPDRMPPYHQIDWAGYITSATRAQLYLAAMQRPEDVIMLATDAVYSLEPLTVATSDTKELGYWEYDILNELVAVQSGVYWYRKGDEWTAHTRGFGTEFADGKEPLTRERVLDAWAASDYTTVVELACSSRRQFVSFGAVAAGIRPREDLGQWRSYPKVLNLTPTGKRWLEGGLETMKGAHLQLIDTQAAPNQSPELQSAPHRPAFTRANIDRLAAVTLDQEGDVHE